MGLGICQGCRKFARGETCPFCGAAVCAPKALPEGRRNRAGRAVVAAAAATVTLAASCSAYGLPPMDDSGVKDSGNDTMMAAYGGPPMGAGGN